MSHQLEISIELFNVQKISEKLPKETDYKGEKQRDMEERGSDFKSLFKSVALMSFAHHGNIFFYLKGFP